MAQQRTNDLTMAASLVALGWEAKEFTPSPNRRAQVWIVLESGDERGASDLEDFIDGKILVEPGHYEKCRRELLGQIRDAQNT